MVSLTSLVSYWKLDEASGTRSDSHGTNHLTDNNTVGSATGIRSNGADFEASSSEYLSCASNSTLQMGDIDFTITAWVKMETVANSMIVTKDDDAGSSRDYTLDWSSLSGGGYRLYINGGGSTPLITQIAHTPTVGVWDFVVAWHDAAANTLNIQVNNGFVNAVDTTGTAPQVSASQFRIGAREYSGFEDYFDGVIDEVSLWKRVLTSQERTDLYNSGAGLAYPLGSGVSLLDNLVSYWKMDEASGTRADAHSLHHLTDINTVGAATGIINDGANIDSGFGEYFSLADNASMSLGIDSAFYWSMWIKLSTTTDLKILVNKGNVSGTNDEYLLWLNSGGKLQLYVGNGSASQSVLHGTTLSTATWYFVEFWHDPAANQIGIAVNGGADATASWSGGTLNSPYPLTIGAGNNGATGWIDSVVDEVGFWKGRVLDSGERASLYNSGAGFAYPFAASSTTAYKDVATRVRIAIRAFKDAVTRTRISGRGFKDATSRLAVRAGAYKDAGVRLVVALGDQYGRPMADVSNDNWTNELGATTGLYASIDETTASDADYIQSAPSPINWEEYKTRISDLVYPAVFTGHTIRLRYQKDVTGGDRIDLMVSLYRADGTTLITQQGYADIDALTTVDINLSELNVDDIPYADYPDLVIGLAAIHNTGGGGIPPWL